jgi:hypothetical protein
MTKPNEKHALKVLAEHYQDALGERYPDTASKLQNIAEKAEDENTVKATLANSVEVTFRADNLLSRDPDSVKLVADVATLRKNIINYAKANELDITKPFAHPNQEKLPSVEVTHQKSSQLSH